MKTRCVYNLIVLTIDRAIRSFYLNGSEGIIGYQTILPGKVIKYLGLARIRQSDNDDLFWSGC